MMLSTFSYTYQLRGIFFREDLFNSFTQFQLGYFLIDL